MPVPRVFISSTCYDLHEVRFNLRQYIEDYGFEPVMSEFGDIFFRYEDHVQDSCLSEIANCNLYILIVGNLFGSAYYKEKETDSTDSVTMKEFSKSLEQKMPKHIFINKFVHYDYKNYRKKSREYLSDKLSKESDITDEKTNAQRIIYDNLYPFAHEDYKKIFKFIDIIYDMNANNAIFEFESVDEIKSTLKKQWAGYVYESLMRAKNEDKKYKEKQIFNNIESKLTLLENMISKINNADNISFAPMDASVFSRDLVKGEIESVKESVDENVKQILGLTGYNIDSTKRLIFTKKINEAQTIKWLQSLSTIINTYKWSKTIPITDLFIGFTYKYWEKREDVPYEFVLELNEIFKRIATEDHISFSLSIIQIFNKITEIEKKNIKSDDFSDDIPF